MSNSPQEIKEIKEHLAVIKHAAATSSATLAQLQEALIAFNRATAKQTCITILLTVLITLAALCSAWAAIVTFDLTNEINAPNVGLTYDQQDSSFILKNYGKLPAKDVRIFWKRLSFGKGEVVEEGRSEVDFIYGDDYVVIPREKMLPEGNTHFLIYAWIGNSKDGVRKRVFLNEFSGEYGWITTTKSLVDSKQWTILIQHLSELETKLKG